MKVVQGFVLLVLCSCVGDEPCTEGTEPIDLSAAEAETGIDSASEASRLADLGSVSWEVLPVLPVFSLTIGEPEAFREPDIEGCPDPVTLIASDILGSIAAEGYFDADVSGYVNYWPDEMAFVIGGTFTSAGTSLRELIMTLGIDPETVEEYSVGAGGSPEGGMMSLSVEQGSGGEGAYLSGAWAPVE